MKFPSRRQLAVVACMGAMLAVLVPQTRWRLHAAYLHLTGQIPDIEFGQLVAYMMPGSEQNVPFLLETRNPYASIHNFHNSEADLRAGAALFRDRCASCHAGDGTGGSLAPSLVGRAYKHGESDWAVYRTISRGVPNTAMIAMALPEQELWQVISFLRAIDIPDVVESADAEPNPTIRVPYDELAQIREPANDWLTFSGSYRSTRHSSLAAIDRGNVAGLRAEWVHQFEAQPKLQVSPLVRDGVMFVTAPLCLVQALDASTGKELWSYRCTLANDTPGDVGDVVSRGVALLDDKVFVTTWDARLIALSAATGRELWNATVAEENDVYFISSAPLAVRDLIVTGVSTRRIGRAYVAAFDAATGQERWRFYAIPGEGEPGNDTWKGDSWKVGGAPTWLTGSYDVEHDLLYWGTGAPKPDYDTATRLGDNLYTSSAVALRGATGELVWHFQFTPAGDKDWDAAQIPVLVDRPTDSGATQQLILWANRNGFYYVLDRVTGKFITGVPFVYQNWAAGLDANGRPILADDGDRGLAGRLLHPGNVGGTSWWPPTFFPAANLMIVPVLEQGMYFFSSNGSYPLPSGRSSYTAIRALDAFTGDLVWERRNRPNLTYNLNAGTASTAGGLVFGSDGSLFFALDAHTGQELWSFETGGPIIAAPTIYSANGRQFVTVAGGSDLFGFALPRSAAATLTTDVAATTSGSQ